MMLMPLWIFLSFAIYAFTMVAFVAGFALCFRSVFGRGSAVTCVCGLGLLGLGFIVAFGDRFESPERRARILMRLPPEAQVISAEYGDWSGDGTVAFKLPANPTARAWFEAVWNLNRVGGPTASTHEEARQQAIRRSEMVGEDVRSLDYNADTQLYRYQVTLGL